jgi:hypothetical protein
MSSRQLAIVLLSAVAFLITVASVLQEDLALWGYSFLIYLSALVLILFTKGED